MTNFMDFEAWKSREDELIEIEEKYGKNTKDIDKSCVKP